MYIRIYVRRYIRMQKSVNTRREAFTLGRYWMGRVRTPVIITFLQSTVHV